MTITRELGLNLRLTGMNTVRTYLSQIQEDANKIQSTFNSFSLNFGSNINLGSNGLSDELNAKFLVPIDNVIQSLKTKKIEFGNGVQSLSNTTVPKIILQKNALNLQPSELDPIIQDLVKYAKYSYASDTLFKDQYGTSSLNGLANYANNLDKIKKLSPLPDPDPTIAERVKLEDKEVEEKNKLLDSANKLVQTGFGLHIAQIYIAPILYGLEQISAKIVSVATEFDKLYTDYAVKSQSFGSALDKNSFYSASVGQTYGLSDAAKTAERFAASGIDVSKSQKALTSVMQVATAADMDYTDAANGVIQTLAGMHMQVSETTKVTDALINSANASTAELSDLVTWFDYSASSAYRMGLNVNQLAAYLGVLSSTGTPNTGAAMRQLFIQLSKSDIQQAFKSKYSFLTDKDFTDISGFISKMRDYIQTSKDQNATTLEAIRLLGGHANAQQAFNNLVMASPDLWNQVNTAVSQTGSTQDLYNKITDNAADAIKKMQVNLGILFTQLGESVLPILKVAASVFTVFTNIMVALPGPIKTILGVVLFGTTIFAALTFTTLGLIGALAILNGTLNRMKVNGELISGLGGKWATTLKELVIETYKLVFANKELENSMKGVESVTAASVEATNVMIDRQAVLSKVAMAASGAVLGYMTSSSLMQQSLYGEAQVVGFVTAAWLAYNAAKVASMLGQPELAIPAAAATFIGYEAFVNDQINTAKNNALNAEINRKLGLSGSTTTVNRNVNINNLNATISDDGLNISDLANAADVGDDY